MEEDEAYLAVEAVVMSMEEDKASLPVEVVPEAMEEDEASLPVEVVAAEMEEDEASLPVEAPAATKIHAATSVRKQLELILMAKKIIILVGSLIIMFHPVGAIDIPASVNGVPVIATPKIRLDDYPELAYQVRRIIKKKLYYTMPDGKRVLQIQTVPQSPPAWLYDHILDREGEIIFVKRSDNLYVCGYIIRVNYDPQGLMHAFEECARMFPNSINLGIGGSYAELYGKRSNLRRLNLGEHSMRAGLSFLSRYRHKYSDFNKMTKEVSRYVLVLSEGPRFTEIDKCLERDWETIGCNIRRPRELLVSWATLSCGVLEGWPRSGPRSLIYEDTLRKLGTTRKEAGKLLGLVLAGRLCIHGHWIGAPHNP